MGTVWLTAQEIAALPTVGAAWDAVNKAARGSWGTPDVSDQDSQHDVYTLAGALVATRLGDDTLRQRVISELNRVPGTEAGARALALGRNLGAYAAAANTIGYHGIDDWLRRMLTWQSTSAGSITDCHKSRPNNWGVMCGWSRVAIGAHLGIADDLAAAANVWRGWLGNYDLYHGFKWGSLSWQANPAKPVGINPKGATKQGHPIDGVLPDDQRRTGDFAWPPPCGNYVRGAIGAVSCALWTLSRNGYPEILAASDSALRRAIEWYAGTPGGKPACQFSGDDAWQPYLHRRLYPGVTTSPGSVGAVGKPMAWTAWTHQ